MRGASMNSDGHILIVDVSESAQTQRILQRVGYEVTTTATEVSAFPPNIRSSGTPDIRMRI
jgi:SepF-like predicted cell division protein (DUF552 family)